MHGHLALWTHGLLITALYYAGFDDVRGMEVGRSHFLELRDIEGHGKVIGNEFNAIETVVADAVKTPKD